jgi:hypothetical protein
LDSHKREEIKLVRAHGWQIKYEGRREGVGCFMEGAGAVQDKGLSLAASTAVYSYAGCLASEKHSGPQPV